MKRRGILAAMLGVLPVLGQDINAPVVTTAAWSDPYLIFNGEDGQEYFEVGWDTKKRELVVRGDKRETRIPVREIMDILEGK